MVNTALDITYQTVLTSLFSPSVMTTGVNPSLIRDVLLPEEEVCIKNAVPKRRLEFIAGRICARALLSRCGWPEYPIVSNKDRTPVWPSNIVGSISHTDGFCGVALAIKADFSSVGLDIQYIGKMKQDIWKYIATPFELNWIESLPGCKQQKYATLIFSAKECFYKCQYMITKRWFDFHDVIIGISSESQEFTAQLSSDKACLWDRTTLLHGKYVFHDQYVLTGMCIPAQEILNKYLLHV